MQAARGGCEPRGPSTGGGPTGARGKGAPYRSAPWVRSCNLSCFYAVRSLQQMSFLEFFFITRPALQATLNYPPLPTDTGRLLDNHHYPQNNVFSKALNA